jgi:phytanoyl-CoA hydroxylase
MPDMEKSARAELDENGYAVVRGLLNPAADLEPLKTAYSGLINELAKIYTARTGSNMPENFKHLPFVDRLCYLIGISHGEVFQHLAPCLSVMDKDYSWDGELPCAELPEMFDLMRHPAIIGMIREFIGPEILATSRYHTNIKLSATHMGLMKETATKSGGDLPDNSGCYHFFAGQTGWHVDSAYCLADARTTNSIIAWVPLTDAHIENSCLLIVPGSHRLELTGPKFPDEITARGVPLEAAPGDVVFMNQNTLHASTRNSTDHDIRWAFNARYCVAGEPSGRPYLPGFIADSIKTPSKVLKDAAVWQRMWRNALENIANIQPIPSPWETSLEDAATISRYWEEKAPDPEAWLNLNK